MSKSKQNHLKLHQSFIFNPKWYNTFTLGLFAFLCAYVTASILTPVKNSDASTVIINNTLTGYYVKITSADNLTMNVDASPIGQLKSIKDTINVVTNSPNGYNLYVSTSTPDNNIYQNGDSSTASQGYFRPSSGTTTTPTPLEKNTWGFALNKSNNTYGANFADVSKYADSGVPDSASTWSAVPNADNLSDAHISSADSPNYEDGTDVDIYYGISASTSLPTGSYSATVTYTAFSEGVNQFASMQDFTAAECGQMVTGQSIILSDSRDGKYYRVTKLADSNCWMTQNLALDGADEFGRVRTLTPADSNVTTNRTLAANIENGTASAYDVAQIYSGNANSTTTDCGSYSYCVVSDEKYGNLYNWNAATAGVGLQATTGTVAESICPKGWRLPDNTGDYSWNTLMSVYNLPTTNGASAIYNAAVVAIQQLPLKFPVAGAYVSTSINQSRVGYYWSRTVFSSDVNSAYTIHFGAENGSFNPQYADYKARGFSVRCVFDQSSTSMQDFTAASCTALGSEASITLMDKRDGKEYRVTKLKDGNCWMTSNLALDGGRTLTTADSNVTQSRTLPANIPNGTASQYDVAQIYSGNANDTTTDCGTYAYCVTSDVKYGNLYNWNAATATVGLRSTTGSVSESICPKGWRLPTGYNEGYSWYMLMDAFGYSGKYAKEIQQQPLYLVLAGRYMDGSVSGMGSTGYYWSRTVHSNVDPAYALRFYASSGTVNPVDDILKSGAVSVRCIFGS